MASPMERVLNMPIAARATPNMSNKHTDVIRVTAINSTGMTLDKYPRESP